MFSELDVVKLKRDLVTHDLDGEPVTVKAGSEGTIIIAPTKSSKSCLEYTVEFGHGEDAFMIVVNEPDIELRWSIKTKAYVKSDDQ